nr:gram-negative bacterial tonB protein [uncultured bacterium]
MNMLFTVIISLLSFEAVQGQIKDSIVNSSNPDAVLMHEGVIICSFESLSVPCEYPGGMDAFYNLLRKNVKRSHLKKAAKANTRITFIVSKDGTMMDINVLSEPNKEIKDEIIKALALAVKWSPGIKSGSPITTSFDLPVVKNNK